MSRCPCNRCSSLVLAAPVPAARSSRKAPRPVPGSTNWPGLAKPSALRNSLKFTRSEPGATGRPWRLLPRTRLTVADPAARQALTSMREILPPPGGIKVTGGGELVGGESRREQR